MSSQLTLLAPAIWGGQDDKDLDVVLKESPVSQGRRVWKQTAT